MKNFRNLLVIWISFVCFFGVLQQNSFATPIVFNLSVANGSPVGVQVTLDDDMVPGAVKVTVEITGPITGDINGVFFDLKDVGMLSASDITGNPGGLDALIREGAVNNIGNGVNMNGSGQSFFDVGVRIGLSGGISHRGEDDDFQMGMFTVAGVSISDFTSFGVRVNSVGDDREGSSKLSGLTLLPFYLLA